MINLIAATVLSDLTVRLTFSELIDELDPALLDTASWPVINFFGTPVTVNSVSWTSPHVYLHLSPMTKGGVYEALAIGMVDVTGSASFYGQSAQPVLTVENLADNYLECVLDQSLSAAPSTVFFHTIYPVQLTATTVIGVTSERVAISTVGMTQTDYTVNLGLQPAIAYDGPRTGVPIGSSEGRCTNINVLSRFGTSDFGWRVPDTSGLMASGDAALIASLEIDTSNITYSSDPGADTILEWVIRDADVSITLGFNQNRIRISSGAYIADVPFDFLSGTLLLTKNPNNDLITLEHNGDILYTASLLNFGEPSVSPGFDVILKGQLWAVDDFGLVGASVYAGTAVYTVESNLVSTSKTFIGNISSAHSSSLIKTSKAPMVKPWGDGTPASYTDVAVLVNGVPVTVTGCNPYRGEITISPPIPFVPAGGLSVTVDYVWQQDAVNAFSGLDDYGQVLDQDGLVLDAEPVTVPYRAGHRFIGFEREYTAALDSPTTLLLDQAPGQAAIPGLEYTYDVVSKTYTADDAPQGHFILEGTDTGSLDFGAGTYTLKDEQSGTYGPTFAYYQKPAYIFEGNWDLAFRVLSLSSTYHGVFSGIGFGLGDQKNLALYGLLRINGLEHIGLLITPEAQDLQSSWVLPGVQVTALSRSTLNVDLPVGTRFQILAGVQTGVYEVVQGSTISPMLPASIDVLTGKYFEIHPETKHSVNLVTYLVTKDTTNATLTLNDDLNLVYPWTRLPGAGRLSLVFQDNLNGCIFWGSLSRPARSESRWSLVRYIGTPIERTSILPVQTRGFGWSETTNFGHRDNAASFGGTSLGYALRDEVNPFLDKTAVLDMRLNYAVAHGTCSLVVADGAYLTELTNLYYNEDIARPNAQYRQLINSTVEQHTFAGILIPEEQGWFSTSATGTVNGPYFGQLTKGTWNLPGQFVTPNDFQFECRFKIENYVAHTDGYVGVQMRVRRFPAPQTIQIKLRNNGRVYLNDVISYPMTWDNHEFHTYKLCINEAGVVSLYLDGAMQLPTTTVADYGYTPAPSIITWGATDLAGHAGVTSTEVYWESVFIQNAPTAKRTLGIWLGGPKGDINSYEIPRSDNSTAPNSYLVGPVQPGMDAGPVVQEWDWRSTMQLRLLKDSEWGVTVFRPDLPLPPYYKPQDEGFITEVNDPSAGWISVGFANLPITETTTVSCGSDTVFQAAISNYSLKLFKAPPAIDRRAPHLMTLDQYNVINSGELTKDVTLEVLTLAPASPSTIDLTVGHIYAQTIFKVVDGSTIWTSESWTFENQVLTLTPDPETLAPRVFSAPEVEVVFTPGNIVTNTYLERQPLLDSVTLLNDGTPPVALNLIGSAQFGVTTTGIAAPYKQVGFTAPPNTFYEALELIQVQEGVAGLLSTVYETGLFLDLSGSLYHETITGLPEDESSAFVFGEGIPDEMPLASSFGLLSLRSSVIEEALSLGAEYQDRTIIFSDTIEGGPWGGPLAVGEYPYAGVLVPKSTIAGRVISLTRNPGGGVASFTAVNGSPVNPGDWSTNTGIKAINLKLAINSHPVASTYVRATTKTLAGMSVVEVQAISPLTPPEYWSLGVSSVAEINVGTRTGNIPQLPPDPTLPARLVINEVNYDDSGSDLYEYVEIYNAGGTSYNLAGVNLEVHNGTVVTSTWALSTGAASIPPGGFLVLGTAGMLAAVPVGVPTITIPTFTLPNGPGGLRINHGGFILDSMSYEGTIAGYTEGSAAPLDPGATAQDNIARVPSGTDTGNNSVDFVLRGTRTPGWGA